MNVSFIYSDSLLEAEKRIKYPKNNTFMQKWHQICNCVQSVL